MGNEALFSPFANVKNIQDKIYNRHQQRVGTYRLSLPKFVQFSMEWPARCVVRSYLKQLENERPFDSPVGTCADKVVMQDEAYGLEPQHSGDVDGPSWRTWSGEAAKDVRDRVGGPHRWAYAKYGDFFQLPMLIGEYKNPSGRTVNRLRTLMQQGDIYDFFGRAAKDDGSGPFAKMEVNIDMVYSKNTDRQPNGGMDSLQKLPPHDYYRQ